MGKCSLLLSYKNELGALSKAKVLELTSLGEIESQIFLKLAPAEEEKIVKDIILINSRGKLL